VLLALYLDGELGIARSQKKRALLRNLLFPLYLRELSISLGNL
jgi:hypothetical protein